MLIGCDPEFVYFNTKDDSFISANTLSVANSDLGCDGHVETGELRPSAGENAKEVITHIYSLFEEAEKYPIMKDVGMLAGHYKHNNTIGGHIHISGFSMEMATLYNFLEMVFKPLSNTIDNLEERAARLRSGVYGTGYRSQGNNWVEYRSPGSWLLSPDVAYLHLGLAECISYNYIDFLETGNYLPFEIVTADITRNDYNSTLMDFIANSKTFPDREILSETAHNVLTQAPLDWSVNIKDYWL